MLLALLSTLCGNSFSFCLLFYYLSLNINWRQGYAPPNSDRREAVLRRKRLEYLESVGQFYDLPDSERSDDEINMLRQVLLPLLSLRTFKSILATLFFLRLLLTVQGLYQTSASFSKHRCRSHWSVFFTRGELENSGFDNSCSSLNFTIRYVES